MIITFDSSTLSILVNNPSLKSDESVVRSLNNILLLSRDKEHLVLCELTLLEYLIDEYFDVLDKSSMHELHFLRNSGMVDHEAFFDEMPHYINILFDDSVPTNVVNSSVNPRHTGGKIFNVNINSFKSHIFLSNNFVIISENESDVHFYKLLASMYMREHYQGHEVTKVKTISGIGGNTGKIIEQSLSNNEKILVICDPDIRYPQGSPKSDSTHNKAINAYRKYKKNNIIHFLSLSAHEKENLIPVSWFQKYNKNFKPCKNVLMIENSIYADRLLYIDLKKGIKKIDLLQDDNLLKYYDPVIKELNISFDKLKDDDKVFSVSACSNWDKLVKRVLETKKISDFPDYLENNISSISLNVIGWSIGGRNGIA